MTKIKLYVTNEEYEALKAEIASLKAEIGMLKMGFVPEGQAKSQAEEIARLKELLKIYGKHRSDAEVFCESYKHSEYPCTCGYSQALAEKGGGK